MPQCQSPRSSGVIPAPSTSRPHSTSSSTLYKMSATLAVPVAPAAPSEETVARKVSYER